MNFDVYGGNVPGRLRGSVGKNATVTIVPIPPLPPTRMSSDSLMSDVQWQLPPIGHRLAEPDIATRDINRIYMLRDQLRVVDRRPYNPEKTAERTRRNDYYTALPHQARDAQRTVIKNMGP